MFGRTKDETAQHEREVLDAACCVVEDAVQEIVEECCVEIEQSADEAILAKGHPKMRGRFTPAEWDRMSYDERDAAWAKVESDVEVYHAAYLRVHGVECRDCAC